MWGISLPVTAVVTVHVMARRVNAHYNLMALVDSFLKDVSSSKPFFEDSCLGSVLSRPAAVYCRAANSESAACRVNWSWLL